MRVINYLVNVFCLMPCCRLISVCVFCVFLFRAAFVLYYCEQSQTITFKRLDVGSTYLYIRCTSREYRSSSFM